MTQIIKINRHRLSVAEDERSVCDNQHQRYQDRAENIDMRNGIERQSAKSRRGRITQPICHPTVGDLVKDDRH